MHEPQELYGTATISTLLQKLLKIYGVEVSYGTTTLLYTLINPLKNEFLLNNIPKFSSCLTGNSRIMLFG